jgi:hypothetical protein
VKKLLPLLLFICIFSSAFVPMRKLKSTPLYDVEKGWQYITDKIWSKPVEIIDDWKEKWLQSNKTPKPLTTSEKWERAIFYGFGNGWTAIGAVQKFWKTDFSRQTDWSNWTHFSIACLLFLQLLFLPFAKLRLFIPFLSLLILLLALVLFGQTNKHEFFMINQWGWWLFFIFHATIIVVRQLFHKSLEDELDTN